MFSDRYLFEKFLRWAFSVGLVAVVGLTFFNSELYRRHSWWLTGEPAPRYSRSCFFQLSSNPNFTAGIGFPQFESFVRRARNQEEAVGFAKEACQNEQSLATVYLREMCDGQTRAHQTVGCER